MKVDVDEDMIICPVCNTMATIVGIIKSGNILYQE